MNKQELTEKVAAARSSAQSELNRILSYRSKNTDYDRGRRNAYVEVETWIKDLDKVQKVTVPKFVADWINQCKEKATLADCLDGYYEISNGEVVSSEDFQNWVADNENDELTAKAWMFGYEVKKEPLYYVIINKEYLVLMFTNRKDHRFIDKDELVEWHPSGYQLKEAEIKEIDERYWAFAVPVEEVK